MRIPQCTWLRVNKEKVLVARSVCHSSITCTTTMSSFSQNKQKGLACSGGGNLKQNFSLSQPTEQRGTFGQRRVRTSCVGKLVSIGRQKKRKNFSFTFMYVHQISASSALNNYKCLNHILNRFHCDKLAPCSCGPEPSVHRLFAQR